MPRLIALAGRAGSGKNTVADMLGGKQISFAAPLKRFVQEVFDFTYEQVWGPSEFRNAPDERYQRGVDAMARPVYLTPRHALQTLGTDWGRACYQDVWAALGVREALKAEAAIAVITDCRFVNEARAVVEAGGEVWRIVRPGAGLEGAAGLHPSEVEQSSPAFLGFVHYEIHNNGTLDDLERTVTALI